MKKITFEDAEYNMKFAFEISSDATAAELCDCFKAAFLAFEYTELLLNEHFKS